MIVEALVLLGLSMDKIARIDLVRPDRQAPGAVAREKGAQQGAVAGGDDDGRDRARGRGGGIKRSKPASAPSASATKTTAACPKP